MSTERAGRLRQAAQASAAKVAPSGMSHHSNADMHHRIRPRARARRSPRGYRGLMSSPFDFHQLGAMLQQLGAMLQSGAAHSGPVNWDLALTTARQSLASAGDPDLTEQERVEVATAIDLAETWLDGATTFPRSIAQGAAWTRAQWLDRTLPAWTAIVAPIAEHVQSVTGSGLGPMTGGDPNEIELPEPLREMFPGGIPPEAMAMMAPLVGMAQQMGASMFGLQVGQGLGALAGDVLGSSDVGVPLTDDHVPTLVPANVASFTEGLGIDADEVRRMVELDGCKVELIYTQEDNYYVYARLTQPDGNVWHGLSGYGVGAGLEDAGYGYSTSEREIMLWELFGHREAPNAPNSADAKRSAGMKG